MKKKKPPKPELDATDRIACFQVDRDTYNRAVALAESDDRYRTFSAVARKGLVELLAKENA